MHLSRVGRRAPCTISNKVRFGGVAPIALVLAAIGVAPSASGDLVIDITGVSNGFSDGASTTWMFSVTGPTAAGDSGAFESSGDIPASDATPAGAWRDVANFATSFLNDAETVPTSGVATLTIGTNVRTIDMVWVDDDPGGGAVDDISVGVDGDTDFSFNSADAVSWTGSLVVPIDIDDLDGTGFSSFSSSNFGGKPGTLALTVNFTAIPEPSALLLLFLPLAACASFQLYRRCRHRSTALP